MSMDLDCYLTKTQQHKIIETIANCCRRFQAFEREYKGLFHEPYTVMRHKHALTSAVLSGFAPGTMDIDGITTETVQYGLGCKLAQPELRTQNAVFHIYSNGSTLKGRLISDRCKVYNTDLNTLPIFFIIVFHATNKGALKKIEVCYLDENASIKSKETIYTAPKIQLMAV